MCDMSAHNVPSDSMTVVFDADLEDFTTVHMHVLHRTGKAFQWKLTNGLVVTVGILMSSLLILEPQHRNLTILIIISILAGSSFIVFGDYMLTALTRRALRKSLDNDPTPVEIGIRPSGLFYQQLGTFIENEWHKVEKVTENNEAILFDLVGGGAVSVPIDIFVSEAERTQFVELGVRYIKTSSE